MRYYLGEVWGEYCFILVFHFHLPSGAFVGICVLIFNGALQLRYR